MYFACLKGSSTFGWLKPAKYNVCIWFRSSARIKTFVSLYTVIICLVWYVFRYLTLNRLLRNTYLRHPLGIILLFLSVTLADRSFWNFMHSFACGKRWHYHFLYLSMKIPFSPPIILVSLLLLCGVSIKGKPMMWQFGCLRKSALLLLNSTQLLLTLQHLKKKWVYFWWSDYSLKIRLCTCTLRSLWLVIALSFLCSVLSAGSTQKKRKEQIYLDVFCWRELEKELVRRLCIRSSKNMPWLPSSGRRKLYLCKSFYLFILQGSWLAEISGLFPRRFILITSRLIRCQNMTGPITIPREERPFYQNWTTFCH